jgi:ketosteroid isomerase-like protein
MKTLLTLTICTGLAVSAMASTKSVRKQLEADYSLFAKAWHNKDLGPTEKFMTEDFTAVGMDPSGKALGRDEMNAHTKQLLVADHITWPRHILSVDVHGGEAVAVVDGHFTGLMPAQKDGKRHKFELIAKTRDTWVLVGKEWKFKKMEIVKSSMKMDGKAMKQ